VSFDNILPLNDCIHLSITLCFFLQWLHDPLKDCMHSSLTMTALNTLFLVTAVTWPLSTLCVGITPSNQTCSALEF
jgi:hypothetical protein